MRARSSLRLAAFGLIPRTDAASFTASPSNAVSESSVRSSVDSARQATARSTSRMAMASGEGDASGLRDVRRKFVAVSDLRR